MKHTVKTIFAAAIISVLSTFASVEGRELPKAAKLVPPETVLLVEVDNFSQLEAQFEKTTLYKFYKDPAMAAFIEDTKTKWREKIQELDDNDIFKTIINADVLPQRRVAIALVLNEQTKDTNEPPILFITQWGEAIDKIKEAVNKMAEKNVEYGGHQKRSEDYRGVSIKIMVDEESSTFSYCFIDDCFIGSMNLDVLKFVIAHIKGAGSPTLADDADYNAAIAAVGPYHDIDFYVNIKQIIKTMPVEDAASEAQMMANLGFDNVAAFGCSIGLGRSPGSSCNGKAFLKIEGGKRGVCKMLEVESAVVAAPRFIPASAYSITFLNLNIKKAYSELANILNSFSPQAAAIIYTPLLPPSPDGRPGLQLKSNIIDHLGSQTVIAQSINKPFSSNSTPAESLVALAINNRNALEKSLSLLHDKMIAPNNPDARRELLGHTIYLVDLSAILPLFGGGMTPMQHPAGTNIPPMPKLAFTVTDTHLIFGVESTVERAIRTLGSTGAASVASAKWFNNARSAIPSVVGLAGLQDNAASVELLWWMMKQSNKARSKDSSVSIGVSAGSNPGLVFSQTGLFNFGLLPGFGAVRKYFGSSASYGISRPDGFFFEFKYLNPAAAN